MSTPQPPIYTSYSATTPMDPHAVDKMIPYLCESFGNPASRSHPFGWETERAIETAREQVATLVNTDPCEIVWTSGTTESNNLVAKGAANFRSNKGKHTATVKTEYKVVLDTMRELERQGFKATYLDMKGSGLTDIDVLKQAIRPDIILALVMMVNNEIGVTQDIEQFGEICRGEGMIFHVNAAQATGKIEIDLQRLRVDLMLFSAHKTYGPKGIGTLHARRKPRIHIEAQMHGSGHEHDTRSGTLTTYQVVGMGEALRIARGEMTAENERIRMLCDRLYRGSDTMEEVYVNGDTKMRVPHSLNTNFNFVEDESPIMAIKDVIVSSGSACASASLEPLHVSYALGHNDELAHSSIRFTAGHSTTEGEVNYVVELLRSKISKLCDLSPLWEMYEDGVDLSNI